MGEIVPAFVFYHTSLSIQALEEASKKIFAAITNRMNTVSIIEEHKTGTEERIMQIWSLYEKVRNVVSRANHLLGPFILLSNGSEFIMISCMSYSIHIQFQNHSLDPVFYLHHHIGSFHLAPGIMRLAHGSTTTICSLL